MIQNNDNKYGVSPVIGVILLVAVFTGVVALLSFNIFASDVGVVKESFDAEVGFEPYNNTGVNVSVWQNENIQRLIVRHECGQEKIIDQNTYNSTTTIDFGPGNYYLIGENNQDKKRLLSKKRIEYEILRINAPDAVSTNEDIQYSIDTNFDSNNITSYNWNFGDGNNSTESNIEYNYSSENTYTTNITISLNSGEEVSKEKDIIVDSALPNPEAPNNK